MSPGDQERDDQVPKDMANWSHAEQPEPSAPLREDRNAQPQEKTPNTEDDPSPAPLSARLEQSDADALKHESQQALEQWLRQIPDDPGGLLRRKFYLEHLKRRQHNQSPVPSGGQAW